MQVITVGKLRKRIRELPSDKPKVDPKKWYLTQKEHWLGWLNEYHGPGAYGRKNEKARDAEYAYNHIVETKMLLWLIEAAGVDGRRVRAAKRAAGSVGSLSAKSGAVRREVPWAVMADALWSKGGRAKTMNISKKLQPLQAMTIKQPWIHAILFEGKDVENRSWQRSFRGWLAIHSSAQPRREAAFPRGHRVPDLNSLDYSAICGVARVVNIVSKSRSKWFYRPDDGSTNYGWVLEDVTPLPKPIHCKGALGLWPVPPRVVRAIRRQLPRLNFNK